MKRLCLAVAIAAAVPVAACDPVSIAAIGGGLMTARAAYCQGIADAGKAAIRERVSGGVALIECGGDQ